MTSHTHPTNLRHRGFRRTGAAVIVAIAFAVGASVPAWAANAESSKFYDDALVRLERDDIAGAIIQLNNALQKDPNMLAAHVSDGQGAAQERRPRGRRNRIRKGAEAWCRPDGIGAAIGASLRRSGQVGSAARASCPCRAAQAEPGGDTHSAEQCASGPGQVTRRAALAGRSAGARSPVGRRPAGAGERAVADRRQGPGDERARRDRQARPFRFGRMESARFAVAPQRQSAGGPGGLREGDCT